MINNFKWVSPTAIAVLAITTFQADGAERTWVGGAGGGQPTNWNKKQNWTGDLPGASDTAVFATVTTNQPTVNANSSVVGVAFRGAGWTISSGATLTTGTGGINNSAATGTNTVNALIALDASQIWTVASGGTLAVTSVISGGANSLTKAGDGTLTLSGASTYTGGTVLNAGTLQLNGGSDRLATTGLITVNGGTLNLGGNSQTTSGAVKITGGTVSNGTISKTGDAYDLQGGTVSAVLAGDAVGLIKTTSSTTTLTAINTYNGATNVSAGTLLVNGSIASGVEVESGATLGGFGTVAKIFGAGTVGPGNSPGILTSTSVNGTEGLDFNFEFTQAVVGGLSQPIFGTASASGNDVLRLTGATPFEEAFTSNNVININLSGLTLTQGDVLQGGFYADFGGDFLASINSATFNYIGLSDDFSIALSTAQVPAGFAGGSANGYITTFTVIPEPTTTTLLGVAIGGLLVTWRKKTAKAKAA